MPYVDICPHMSLGVLKNALCGHRTYVHEMWAYVDICHAAISHSVRWVPGKKLEPSQHGPVKWLLILDASTLGLLDAHSQGTFESVVYIVRYQPALKFYSTGPLWAGYNIRVKEFKV